MKNYVQDGGSLTLPAPYACASGEGAKIGALFGVAHGDVADGADGVFATRGVFDLVKVEAQAWTVGQKVYWDNAAKVATSTASGNTLIGAATEAASNPSTVGRVRLNGVAV